MYYLEVAFGWLHILS